MACSESILLTQQNQESTQYSPDPFPCGLGMRLLAYNQKWEASPTMSVHNQLVHPSWTQCRGHSTHHHLTSIDVANYLGLPLGGVCPLLQQDDRCRL